MRKKILILVIILAVLILVTGGVFAYLYFGTDTFLSNKDRFLKYISKNKEIAETLIDSGIKEYEEKQLTTAYTSNGSLKANVTSSEITSQEASMLQNSSISFESSVDRANKFEHHIIKTNFSNTQALTFDLLQTSSEQGNEVFAVKFNDVWDTYVGVENTNLKDLARRMELDGYIIEMIPDKIDFSKFNNLKLFTDDEIKQIQQKYFGVIANNLTDDMFSKESTEEGNVYTLSINQDQETSISNAILQVFKDDELVFSKVKTFLVDIMNYSEEDANQYINNIKQQLNESMQSSELSQSETTNDYAATSKKYEIKVKVYEKSRKLLKTELFTEYENNDTTNNNSKLVVEKLEDGAKIEVTEGEATTPYTITLQKNNVEEGIKYNFSVTQGDSQMLQAIINFAGLNTAQVTESAEVTIQYNLNNYNSIMPDETATTSTQNDKYIINYTNTKNFGAEVNKNITGNFRMINTAPNAQSVTNLFSQIFERLVTISNEKMVAAMNEQANNVDTTNIEDNNANTVEDTNLTTENTTTNTVTNTTVDNTTNTDTTSDSNASVDATAFNAQFEAYMGNERTASDVKTLISAIISSNASHPEHKIAVNGETPTVLPTLDNTKTYKISIIYDPNGFVNQITYLVN